MPVSTEVGQSGPPHRIIVLPKVQPGCTSTKRAARMNVELTWHAARTPMRSPRRRPMTSCWRTMATNLRTHESAHASSSPTQKDAGGTPDDSSARSASLMSADGRMTPASM